MENFWNNFWPNFVSDSIVAIIFGLVITLLINKLLHKKELTQARIEQLKKTLELLTIFNDYASELAPKLEKWIGITMDGTKEGDFIKPYISGEIPRFNIEYWYIYKNSNITSNLSPTIIKHLTAFWGELSDARLCLDWLFEHWEQPITEPTKYNYSQYSPRTKYTAELISENILHAHQAIKPLLSQLSEEIPKVSKEIAQLETNKR